MKQSVKAPAHTAAVCAGVFLFLLGACGDQPGAQKDRTLELEGDTITLPAGVDLHEVRIRTGAQYKDFQPAQVQAKAGDYLRFTTADNLTHAIVFEVSAPAQVKFLEDKHQLRSPPLIRNGATWVVALEGAPAGTYAFRCLVHNDRGQLIIGRGR